MGSYASEPKVDKESLDEYNERLNCGASSMQGWRVTQEDAHNCLLNYDTNTYFFAVYDGHGGHEVAHYCSQKLPEFIKSTDAYKEGNIESALVEGFLGFDSTITTPEVISVLKEIAGVDNVDEDSEEEENVDNLYKEATMPIEQVIEKYTSNLINPTLKSLKKSEKAPKSPFLKAKKEDDNVYSCKVESEAQESSNEAGPSSNSMESNSVNSSLGSVGEINATSNSNDSKEKSNDIEHIITEIKITSDVESEKEENDGKINDKIHNGDVSADVVTSSDIQNGDETPKGKGKAKMKNVEPSPRRVSPRTKRSSSELYKSLLFYAPNVEESEDEEDETFEGFKENSSDDDEVTNSHLEEDSENSSVEDDDDDERGGRFYR
ncbi:hypothetical protein WA026_017290 [Henosepilachna vigintioctopunctata]|uniref:PPM-type phosphatase domain-containing protein n=1 Tax=Henosepilachna vigintioctopunctata TaxID=420089 RepID=A0AAW1UDM4_9CUCU